MSDQRRRPEPVANLSNYLFVVASCIRCKSRMDLPLSELSRTQKVSCQACGLSWEFSLDGEVLAAMDQNFRRLEDPIRDREAWVEVRSYP